MKKLIVAIAACVLAAPAASGQFIRFDGVKGESTTATDACGPNGEAIQGSLDRDIIRRIPKSPPQPRAGHNPHKNEIEILSATQPAAGGVQVAVGDVNGDGRADATCAPGRRPSGQVRTNQ